MRPAFLPDIGTIAPSGLAGSVRCGVLRAHSCSCVDYSELNVDKYQQRNKLVPRAPARQTPLGDNRFEELVRQASAFFAAAERDEVAEKAVAIEEIKLRMLEYGLTVDDLVD